MSTGRASGSWEPIAIVGLGGVFPDAADPDALWANVRRGHAAAADVEAARWMLDPAAVRDGEKGAPDRVASARACLVKGFRFDPTGFALPPEALVDLDPLFHLGLTAARQAWTGVRTASLDLARAGVIIGNIVLPDEGAAAHAAALLDGADGAEGAPAGAYRGPGLPGGLIARALGLGLGGWALDAACASSLYAVKLACAELAAGRADLMLAGGVSRPDSLYTQMGFSQLRALSARGQCTPFDAAGDGLVVGEGAGILALKRLADAERDGDRIWAVIRAVGTSNDIDGSLLAPSSEGQLRAMHEAYRLAGWAPGSVDLLECHATGTPLGDGVEVASLKALRGEAQAAAVLGSVKSNVGHLLTAAGAAGLIKTVQALVHRELPPTASFQAASPALGLAGSGLRVLTTAEPWPAADDRPRRAAVSAFGFGGINAHVLVEEYQARPAGEPSRSPGPGDAVAIIGMGVRFGGLVGLRAFQEATLGGRLAAAHGPRPARERAGGVAEGPDVAGCWLPGDVEVATAAFRIPPRELADMLPQQALMLLAADEALRDAGGALADRSARRPRAGAYVGIGLDPRTTDYHRRWRRLARGERPETPALTADRTVGALGGMVASRLAREFRFGGPTHTVQAEEASAYRALEAGVRALQRGEIDVALVGAVDLAGDPRMLAARAAEGAPVPTGEGAGAVVLKRLADAERDGDRIYAIVEGLAAASGGRPAAATPAAGDPAQASAATWRAVAPPGAAAVRAAVDAAWGEAGAAPGSAGLLELDAGALVAEAAGLALAFGGAPAQAPATALGRTAQVVGRAGVAAGMASLVRAALCLYQEILPPWRPVADDAAQPMGPALHRPGAPQYWFRDRIIGPRRAGVSILGLDGTAAHVVLAGAERQAAAAEARVRDERRRPLGAASHGLFALAGADQPALLAALDRLAAWLVEQAPDTPVEAIARGWWADQGVGQGALGLAIVAADAADLATRLGEARRAVEGSPVPGADPVLPTAAVYYSASPLGADAPIAFVFPGSGNHFAGMGRDLWAAFPEIPRRQDAETAWLASQVCPAGLVPWRATWPKGWESACEAALAGDHRTTLLGQVAYGALMHDLVTAFGVKPAAVIGYSLGETAGLVATRTWTDRDALARRMAETSLFTDELGGDYAAAARAWGLAPGERAAWKLGVVDRAPAAVRAAIAEIPRAYLLIVNAPGECVVGGEPAAVDRLVAKLGCGFLALEGVTSVHCEVAAQVEEPYRALHDLPTTPPSDVRFYSGRWGQAYGVTRETAAGSIVAQALEGLDFPAVVRAAYVDGARAFVELGPRNSCSRMVRAILGDRPHLARSACMKGQPAEATLLRLLAHLHAERVPIDLAPIYGVPATALGVAPAIGPSGPVVRVPLHAPRPGADEPVTINLVKVATMPGSSVVKQISPTPTPTPTPTPSLAVARREEPGAFGLAARSAHALAAAQGAVGEAHAAFLALAAGQAQALVQIADLQALAGFAPLPPASPDAPSARAVFMDRDACLDYARGRIGPVLGDYFAPIDAFPTRVRLPDEPLMLVDRIVEVTGERGSLTHGTVVTEHDVKADAWYLDAGRIPTCIAVEAGQADLFLSAWLGIDFKTRGLACYRLLDAVVTFHRPLPGPGATIRYDIAIERFMDQGGVTLFFFRFDGTVDGEPLLTMRRGCAGFFTDAHLAAGRGVIFTALDLKPQPGKLPADWRALAPMERETYDAGRLDALRAGDLGAAFGPAFAGLGLGRAAAIPGGAMRLVDRVVALEPTGGRFGLGLIRAEHDVTPDAWYLTCHFVDDMVMPGTLMFECCMHTLRIHLMRMGWVGEAGTVVYEPLPEVGSRLECRGQVLASTKVVTYEIVIKELGYLPDGTPFALADALMSADGKPIVRITDMSVRASGLQRAALEALWSALAPSAAALAPPAAALYGPERILAYATGKPSEAFGDRYTIFDHDRVIARLPGPPYMFVDRVTAVGGEPWVCQAGAWCLADYDVPPDAWYFADDGQPTMPFAVLLEVGLQPCGWLAAYVGSALTADVDLSFRNLGGKAVQHRLITPTSGTLSTKTTLTKVSISGGMIVQEYEFAIHCGGELVYDGWTMFGFFTKAALAQQVGIRGTEAWRSPLYAPVPFPAGPLPMPRGRMRMVDTIEAWEPTGGRHGRGFIRGRKAVDPAEWYFAAHFYQDPVCPGSLGLESLVQLLKAEAGRRWGGGGQGLRFAAMKPGCAHEWVYRGQIVPGNGEAVVEAHIKAVDDATRTIVADGLLLVDGRPIYGMTDFTIALEPEGAR